ncbi:MAG TPA: hypothetical protein PLJ42_10835 [Chitinophagales bacterium]|jgi:hypothetical protein|nr:hypothetical protein [Chitinophagales bacterium]HQV79127.1 hypothetical protein [Chitinophagales bacterium]HQW79917.1 hypothetical protein [Chitinophagales bacterium]
MRLTSIVINILIVIMYRSVYGQQNTDTLVETKANNKTIQSDYVIKKKAPRQYHKLQKIQTKYLHWIDKKNREFPFAVPAIAYNKYDGVQVGAALINLKQPIKNVDFTATLFYGIKSRKANGTAKIDYYARIKKSAVTLIKPGLKFQSFTYANFSQPLKYYVLSPEILLQLNHKTEKLEKIEHQLLFKNNTVLLKDLTLDAFNQLNKDTLTRFYANTLRYTFKRNDENFPVSASLNIEQTKHFVKTYFEANSFIRYQLKDYKTGVHLRMFVGGFLWRSNNFRFRLHPDVGFNLNGKRGEQDYLYNDIYLGRNEQANFSGRQITKSDGFFKVTTPFNAIETGQTVDWLLAFNLKIDFPIKYVPLKLFLDLGYSFDNHLNPNNLLPIKGFQYDGGFMLSFFEEGFEIYFPLFYSKEYKTYIKSNAPKFGQRITFLMDLHKLEMHKKIRTMKF